MSYDLITLSCPNCGGKLEITPDLDRFACGYCGQEQIVKRSGGTVSLSLVTDAIAHVAVGTDKTAAELAIARLQREISEQIAARHALVTQHPAPTKSGCSYTFFIFSFWFGVLMSIITLLGIIFEGSSAANSLPMTLLIFCIWAGVGFYGHYVYFPYHKQEWEKTIPVQLAKLDAQIAEKQAELKKQQEIVSH